VSIRRKTSEQTRTALRFTENLFIRSKGATMRFRVYCGPRGSAAISPIERQRMLFKEFDSLDAALGWGRHLAASGRVPLLIEGDDGTRLDKRDIAAALAPAEPAVAERAAIDHGEA
jgi:hypothetical protein